MKTYALGMIETIGLTSLIPALDEAVKAANVKVVKYEKADAGIVTGYMIGDVASVQAAVDSGVRIAKQLGGYRSSKVIAKPAESVFNLLEFFRVPKQDKRDIFQKLTVAELQKLAKGMKDFPVKGREFYKLKKAELIEAMVKVAGDGYEA
ncbi:BMC domain-containing protein [Neobacillus niacini]|uniref:BMC domain-containing protein n=1 Tax=Neobacillus niacini TaxID=86668 RepID=UPI0021CB86A8|nr:BMC domain-containing protein [Neobacillus niacini]MCM3768521.1 BMC domain-containing protein [Neobacillus niacini]